MDDGRLPKQAAHWEVDTTKRSKKDQEMIDTIHQDLKGTRLTREEVQQLCINRVDWHHYEDWHHNVSSIQAELTSCLRSS